MKNGNEESRKKRESFCAMSLAVFVLLFFFGMTNASGETAKVEKTETSYYKDAFDQSAYAEGVNQLDFSRWYRKIFRKKVRSADLNVFDEVPDSGFFTNRQGRRKMSPAELEKGHRETDGPAAGKPLTLLSVEQNGLDFEFVVEDSGRDRYIFKFDPAGSMELNTGAEVAASRFYHAVGYNVSQYTVFFFKADQLVLGPGAFTYDNTGFKKQLTREILDRYLSSIPQTQNGSYRASAQKVPPGRDLGSFSFLTHRKDDPDDKLNHRDRREIRALGIFAAWLNDYERCESSTLDKETIENGRVFLKHYLTDFSGAFGASADGAKPAVYGHEHLADYGESFKAFLSLGFWEKPWQKKWREAGEQAHPSPAVGYFSNQYFDPAGYKTQLPYEAFRMVTRADGFWAAKIMAAFTDEDVRSMVKAGQYSSPEDAEFIAKTLMERRDLIVKHWFLNSAPFDQFEFSGGTLAFTDLAVQRGYETANGTVYSVTVLDANKREIAKVRAPGPKVSVDPAWFGGSEKVEFLIRALRPSSSHESPYVRVTLSANAVIGIRHED